MNEIKDNEFAVLLKYFTDNFSYEFLLKEIETKNKKDKIALEIFNRLNDIYTIYNRINLYPDYFERLYIQNDKKISEAEILEYHIQNYLNDFYSFKVKIERLLNFIKNNIREFDIINTEDVKKLINHISKNTDNGFKQVEEVRGTHVHDSSVRDLKITEAKLFLQIMEIIKVNSIDYKDLDKLPDKYATLIKESKEKYIQQSKENCIEVTKYFKFFISRIGFLIASLYGHDTKVFTEMIKSTSEDNQGEA